MWSTVESPDAGGVGQPDTGCEDHSSEDVRKLTGLGTGRMGLGRPEKAHTWGRSSAGSQRVPVKHMVVGSSPTFPAIPTTNADVTQLVE